MRGVGCLSASVLWAAWGVASRARTEIHAFSGIRLFPQAFDYRGVSVRLRGVCKRAFSPFRPNLTCALPYDGGICPPRRKRGRRRWKRRPDGRRGARLSGRVLGPPCGGGMEESMQESGKGMRKVGDAGLTRRNFLFGAALAGAGVAAAGMAGCAGEPSAAPAGRRLTARAARAARPKAATA